MWSMPLVMIHCPVTGDPVSTRHTMSEAQFAGDAFENAAVRCSACGAKNVRTTPDWSEAGKQHSRGITGATGTAWLETPKAPPAEAEGA